MQHGIASTESDPIYPGYSNGANIASSLLLLRSEVLSSVVLFRIMIPFMPEFMPEKVPNLVTKNIFMGAGEHDPLVPREQTEMLFRLFKKAGAKVVLHWEEIAGHPPGYDEILAAKQWLSNLVLAQEASRLDSSLSASISNH